jgi:hypothetical protein
MPFTPVEIVGVIPEEVGSPRYDGSAGSGLYPVPVRLSRSLSADEATLLVALWDRPPEFTSIHRPGIARAGGNRIVLDGTTVDEFARYHAKTLVGVVEQFNVDAGKAAEKQELVSKALKQAEAEHRSHVQEVVGEIRFE